MLQRLVRRAAGFICGRSEVYGAAKCSLGLFLAMSAILTREATAQEAARLGTVAGVAFDSLRSVPLPGAVVYLTKSTRSTVTDGGGRFRFDSLPHGDYTLVLLHEALDSIGLSGVSVPLTVRERTDPLLIGIPSIRTIWERLCGTGVRLPSVGLLFGRLRVADGLRPVQGANISVGGVDLALDATGQVKQVRWSGTAVTDSSGSYLICGIPIESPAQLQIAQDTTLTLDVFLDGTSNLVRRLDLLVPSSTARAGSTTVLVDVRDEGERSLATSASLALDGKAAVTRGSASHSFSNVSPGSHQLEVKALGYTPQRQLLNVENSDTLVVRITLRKVVELAPVAVTARPTMRQLKVQEIERRRTLNPGAFMDSTVLARHQTIRHALSMLGGKTNYCAMFLDGEKTDMTELTLRDVRDMAILEIEPAAMAPLHLRGGCEGMRRKVVLVWSKNGLP